MAKMLDTIEKVRRGESSPPVARATATCLRLRGDEARGR
jgi:hypothetical protein